MLSDLFTTGLQSEDPKKRLQSIARLNSNSESNQEVLKKLVLEDPDIGVRRAALSKINHVIITHQISLTHPDQETKIAAESRLRDLLGPQNKLSESELKSNLGENPDLAAPLVKYCTFARLREKLLEKLSLEEQCNIIGDIEYSETRQLIADKLDSPEHLELARRLLRGKDKNAEKVIKSKLDTLHTAQRALLENRKIAQEICEKVEFLATHKWEDDDKTKYSVWEQRWQALDFTIDHDLQKRYADASSVVIEKINDKSATLESLEGQAQLAKNLDELCKKISRYELKVLADEKLAIIAQLNHSLSEWSSISKTSTPNAETSERFITAERALLSIIDFLNCDQFKLLFLDRISQTPQSNLGQLTKAIADINWPNAYGELAGSKEAEIKLAILSEQYSTTKKLDSVKLDKLHKRIHRLLGTNKRGDLEVAKRELSAIEKIASQFTGKDKDALNERLAQANEAVLKMSDWKDFVTAPKYIELCDSMEALVDKKLHADKLSKEITDLQNRWKALGHAECSEQHWERFKTAGDKAYEPCAIFFKQRREKRRENLKAREPIVESMRILYESTDWDNSPNYRSVEDQLQSLHRAWQKIKDVERGPGQKQWKRLSKFKDRIYEKLDLVYDTNIELKNQLITQTAAILETEVKEESLNKLKLLQNRWKQVGVTRRKQDQAAWSKFKKTSDQVYEQIQGVRNTKRAAQDEKINAHRNISRAIHELAKTVSDLSEADRAYEQLQKEYLTLPPLPQTLPEKLIKGVESDFRRACDVFSKARERIKKDGRVKIYEALSKKADLCGQLESAASESDAIRIEELNKAIADIVIANKDLNTRFEQRLNNALESDRTQANEDRRLMCIDLEILLGIESPPEDASLRMKIQLERMKKKGFGHSQAQVHDSLKKLKIDWLCLPGAEPSLQNKLDQRFKALLDSK